MKMTPEIAIEKIKHLGLYYAAKEEWPTFVSMIEAFKIAIEALEKDIPIKPIRCITPRYNQRYLKSLKKDIPIKSILRKDIPIKSI